MTLDAVYAVYGGGGCGRGIMPLARRMLLQQGIPLSSLVFIDDQAASSEINGQRVLSYQDFIALPASTHWVALGISNSSIRAQLRERCLRDGLRSWSVLAQNIELMDDVLLGEGAVLSPFVTLTSNIRIGRDFHANLYSYVEHDCVIGDFVTFAPGVRCNGNVVIEDHAYIGSGAVIRQGVPGQPLVIGKGAVVGMGAVVIQNVPPGATVVGNPARLLMKKA